MLSLRQVAKAPLVAAVQARQVLVRLPVVARAAVLDLAQVVQQVALVVELRAEQAVLLEVQAELLAVQPEALLVVWQAQLAVLRPVVLRERQRRAVWQVRLPAQWVQSLAP